MKEKCFDWVIRLRVPIMILFLVAAVAGAIAQQDVSVNYHRGAG